MPENQVSPNFSLIVQQTSLLEIRGMRRFSLLSTIVHTVALVIVLTWSGGMTKVRSPVQIITVDLVHIASSPPPAAPPAATPAVHPKPQPAPRRFTKPTPATLPQPVTAVTRPMPKPAQQRPTPVDPIATGATLPTAVPVPTVSQKTATGKTNFKPVPTMPSALPDSTAQPDLPAANRTVEKTSIRAGYMQRCRGLIERHKEYPVMSRKGRSEGTVVIRGTLARNGSLRECIVNRSSGSGLLDNAAVRAVWSVNQFPPVPPELQGSDLVFDLPISFRLSAE